MMQTQDTIKLIEYAPQYQSSVEELVLPIQQVEFGVPTTLADQPDLMDIQGVFQKGRSNFWLALNDDKVVGCVGVVDIGNDQVALKKMFVHRDFRGKQFGISAALMTIAKQWCREHGIKTIFLGTTAGMKAAHRFYEKNGFIETKTNELPEAFPIVHVDSLFYRCSLV